MRGTGQGQYRQKSTDAKNRIADVVWKNISGLNPQFSCRHLLLTGQ